MVLQNLQKAALVIARRLPRRLREWILTAGGRYIYFHPLAQISYVFRTADGAWERLHSGCSVLMPVFEKACGTGRYLDLTMALSLDWQQTRRYEHGTLGIEYGDTEALGNVIVQTFRQTFLKRHETIRVRMPPDVEAASHVRIRVLPAPHCEAGAYKIVRAKFVDDRDQSHPASRLAELDALKERTRNLAAQAEADGAAICEHSPVALTFELTPACNLTCSHCMAHGEPGLHKMNNSLPELSLENLEVFAHEIFPALDVISVVGRGEPFVLKEPVWKRFVELVTLYRVRLAITTNGYFLDRRLTPGLLPLIDSINFSMDGATKDTFAVNRGGADLDRVLKNVELFHVMRRSAGLARSPRLYFAWTLKRNNVAELPDFVRMIAKFDADALTTRHMQIYFSKDADQSLLDMDPGEANRPMEQAYALLEQFDIRRDCVPLFELPPVPPQAAFAANFADAAETETFPDVRTGEDPVISSPIAPSDLPVSASDTPSAIDSELDNQEPNVEAAISPALLPNEPCMFIHRMPVIMAGGEIMACAVPDAVHLGTLGKISAFNAVWNGEVLADIRTRLNTANEWPQCRTCHYREARVTSQRTMAANGERYDKGQQATISRRALDFMSSE